MQINIVPRRIVRIKTLQNFYAYTICKQASQKETIEAIEKQFAFDIFLDQSSKKPQLEKEKKTAVALFGQMLAEEPPPAIHQAHHHKIEQLVFAHVLRYRKELHQNQLLLQARFQQDKEVIYKGYLYVLALLMAWQKMAQPEAPEAHRTVEPLLHTAWSTSSLFQTLLQTSEWAHAVRLHGIHWSEDQIRDWYMRLLQPLPLAVVPLDTVDPNQDIKILEYIVQNLIFKDPQVGDFFSMMDGCWDDHKRAIRKLLTQTFVALRTDSAAAFTTVLRAFEAQWTKEEVFYNRLFAAAVKNDAVYEVMIGDKAEKWNRDRILLTDKILIKLALVEILEIREIPTKVSMNEYIEIAKLYGTPKSSHFVNGVLEGILSGLTATEKPSMTGQASRDPWGGL
jgi:N utilization substance protein B